MFATSPFHGDVGVDIKILSCGQHIVMGLNPDAGARFTATLLQVGRAAQELNFSKFEWYRALSGSWLLPHVPVKSGNGLLCRWLGWVYGSLPAGETLGQRYTR